MNGVVQEKHVETIFDYDLTNQELHKIFGNDIDDIPTYEEYYDLIHDTNDSRNADLYWLFAMRHDAEKAKHYLSLIKNLEYQRCVRNQFR